MMGDTVLRLVPSNWFYNLSVYGFLKVLNNKCGVNVEGLFKEDGSVEIDLDEHGLLEETEEIAPGVRSVRLWDCLFQQYRIFYLTKLKAKSRLTDKDKKDLEKIENAHSIEELYKVLRGKIFYELRNLFNPSDKGDDFKFQIDLKVFKLLKPFLEFYKETSSSINCQYCGEYPILEDFLKEFETGKYFDCLNWTDEEIKKISDKEFKAFCKAFKRLRYLNFSHISYLAPSLDQFPNSFWNLNSSVPLCLVCNILFLFYPLGLIDIGSGQRIFANAPSFELIWKLNQHLEKIHSREVYKDIKTLFSVAFIDLVLDLNIKLGLWQRLSTEVIVFKGQDIDFYEIPPQILELLEDKRISSLLTSLNNLKILNLFLSGNFKLLEVLIYRLLRSAGSDKEDNLLKEFNLHYDPKKVETLSKLYETVKVLSKLYALSVSKLKKTAEVEV